MKRAFTLIELLVVIAIVLLLAGLLLPVVAGAKERSFQATCTSNLRQLVMAITMYVDDNAGEMPRSSDPSVIAGFVGGGLEAVQVCPSDPFGGFATAELSCVPLTPDKTRSSYQWPFWDDSELFWQAILKVDSNPGLLACRVHGQKRAKFSMDPARICAYSGFFYEGLLLRARRDGSVERASFSMEPMAGPGNFETYRRWWLFTDEAAFDY